MDYFTLLLYFIVCKEFPEIMAYANSVSLDRQWPIPIDYLLSFTITQNFNEKSVLVIELQDTEKIRKFVKVGRTQYVDIVSDYYTIKKDIKKIDNSQFTIKMKFLRKSHNKKIHFHWFFSGVQESDEESLTAQKNVIYSSEIQLEVKWTIKLSIEIVENENNERIYFQDEKFFQHGKTAKVTCSAFDGLPDARVYVNGITSKRFRETAFDEKLNTWIGYMTLNVDDHNSSISCHVAGTDQVKILQIKVNHPPTTLILNPEYTGYVKNGTKVKCVPFDGYPVPIVKWDFVSVKNYSNAIVKNHSNSKSLYQIHSDELSILSDVSLGMVFEFDCTAIYTNPINQKITFTKKTFRFEIGEASNSIETVTISSQIPIINSTVEYEKLNKAAIGAGVAGVVIMVIAISIVVMLCRSKPKPSHASTHRQEGSPKYSGSLLAGSKSALHNQMKSQNGASSAFISADTTVNAEPNEFNYDDMPRGRRPIKVVDDPVVYSTIVGTMQPKIRPSLDLGPIDRV